ncbi:hypothetical protein JYU34_020286 [Plutella xylostella]|uniref:Uncharacterized protein n=2 Tax=Plutella xylostella TaxID=51655 RepID=A0ABQ7PUT5_PLUXY|nr:hypothetical protein JYU34_020286 [Plutella xylostella]CAG9135702.1 unnamed protein product [Plutella xylostella]
MKEYTSLLQVSKCLTNERMSQALTDWFNEDLKFTHWEYVSVPGKGDSYMSEVIKIKIHGKNPKTAVPKHVQVILKTIPKGLCRRLTLRSDQFFENEIRFYQDVLPALVKFQSTKNLKDPFVNYPRVFDSYTDGENDYIILGDATLENFVSAVRQEGIDIEHCKVTLKTFAKFHAMSFAMKDQDPKGFKRISNCVFETYYHERYWPRYKKFWDRLCKIAIDAVEKEYPDSIYLNKIKQFATPEAYKKCIDAACNTDETGVISHGDAWTTNFLYKYDKQVPVDAKMIDFQLARCASPVLDISFFIYACTTQELRLKHYDELMKYYYDALASQIDEMGSDSKRVYSWDKYQEEVKKYSFFGLSCSMESTPLTVLDAEDAVDMDVPGDKAIDVDDFWKIGYFKTKEGRLREANNVVHCVDYGYI